MLRGGSRPDKLEAIWVSYIIAAEESRETLPLSRLRAALASGQPRGPAGKDREKDSARMGLSCRRLVPWVAKSFSLLSGADEYATKQRPGSQCRNGWEKWSGLKIYLRVGARDSRLDRGCAPVGVCHPINNRQV
jgi:hypothetical protein